MCNKVFVLDTLKRKLMPCSRKRARELLTAKKASVYRMAPFTIILHYAVTSPQATQPIEVKIDPGSKVTGIALVADFPKQGPIVIFALNVQHRGHQISSALRRRAGIRHGRRQRKTRYRKARYLNRTRMKSPVFNFMTGKVKLKAKLPPSLQHRVDSTIGWIRKLSSYIQIASIATEVVSFDTHLLRADKPIEALDYQRGTLYGYEVKEYLLEKWGRRCSYCNAKDVKLQVEHIHSRRHGGTNAVSNLSLACKPCNIAKGSRDIRDFLANRPAKLKQILAQAKKPLKDAAAMNSTRYSLYTALQSLGLSITTGSGGRTKFNRQLQGYPKDHWVDAACVGENGSYVNIPDNMSCLHAKSVGKGNREVVNKDSHGYPNSEPGRVKEVHGFRTHDIVRLTVVKGRNEEVYVGRLKGIRVRGYFVFKSRDRQLEPHYRHFKLLQHADGYVYA
jgi:5-methylcytosine-specific restriction endonuclease McrA